MKLLKLGASTLVLTLCATGGVLFVKNNPQVQAALSSPAFAGQHGSNNGNGGGPPGNGHPGPNGGGSGGFGGNGKGGGKGNGDNPCPPGTPSTPSPPATSSSHGGGAPAQPDWVNCEGSYTHLLQVLAHHYGMGSQEYTAWLKAQHGISEGGNIPPDVAYGAWKKAFPHWNGNMCETWDPVPWVQIWHPHTVTVVAPVFHAHVPAVASNKKPFQLWMPRISLGGLF